MRAVVGVDAGGSFTRVVVADLAGQVLGAATGSGGSPEHNDDAAQNVRGAITTALATAYVDPSEVTVIVAGIAGLNTVEDQAWARRFVEVDGVNGSLITVNDAEVAHAGAFAGEAGIMVIAGTGSMILGINERREIHRNDHFGHYAGAARHLSFDVMHRMLGGELSRSDRDLVDAALAHWEAPDLASLRSRVAGEVEGNANALKKKFGAFAPMVTAASPTSELANAAIDRLADATRVGIELLLASFESDTVDIALEGGLARSQAFASALERSLRTRGSTPHIAEPKRGPAEGAVLLALRAAGGN